MAKERDQKFYDSLGAKYETGFAHDEGLISFVKTLVTLLPSSSNVLDMGCGTGKPVAYSLAQAGHDVTGVDISEVMVDLSRQAVPNGTFEVSDMRTWSPKDGGNFDAVLNILSLFVLNREEVESMADRWTSWIKPGGLLAVCSIPVDDLDLSKQGGKYDPDRYCARDVPVRLMGTWPKVTLFTRAGWRKMFEDRGFDVVHENTTLFEPPKESQSDPEIHFFIVGKKRGLDK